jgi:hypothetical protein
MNELILPDELTPQDRMKAFREDLRALDELAATVHQKVIEGDNAAGHLDVKIRERKAAMFGYDSPQRHDMTLIAELKRPSSSDVLRRAIRSDGGSRQDLGREPGAHSGCGRLPSRPL